jgi:ketosteroid isomerase-like protein
VQTPQVFRRAALDAALADDAALTTATDDASLVEARGGDVRVLEAPAQNLKVTTPLDLRVAELLLAERPPTFDPVLVVRRSFDLLAAGEGIRVLELMDPEVVWDLRDWPAWGGVGSTLYRGREGVVEFWNAWLSEWESIEHEIDDVADLGENRVLVTVRMRARGRGSGVAVENPPHAQLYTFRDGLITEIRNFADPDTARRALGLPSAQAVTDQEEPAEDGAVVREMLRRFEARENERVYDLIADDVVFDTTAWPAFAAMAGVYHGHAGMRQFWSDWFSMFKDVEVTHDEIQRGPHGVVVSHEQRSIGRQSGIPAHQRYWAVYTVRGGMVGAVNFHDDEDAARRAAGLD